MVLFSKNLIDSPFIKIIWQYFNERHRGLIISLIVLSGIIYVPYLNNHFFFDDSFYLSSTVMESSYFETPRLDRRWLSVATLSWTWKLFLDTPLPFRLGNLALHTVNVILIFFLLNKLLICFKKSTDEECNFRGFAFLGAAVFCAHPVSTYAVGYVIQRSILLATFFVLAMHLTYLKALLDGKSRWLLPTILFYFLAIFSKEHAVIAPASLVAMTIMLRKRNKLNLKVLGLAWLTAVGIAVMLLLRTRGILGVTYETDAASLLKIHEVSASQPNLHIASIATQAGLYFKYLILWILPNPSWMSIDMREPFLTNADSWKTWVGPLAFLTYGITAARLLFADGKLALIGWALLYPWFFFWVEFSTIRIQEPFVLYRSYLWFSGFIAAFCYFSLTFPAKRFLALTMLLLICLVPITWNRLWVSSDNYRLWHDAALLISDENSPGASRIYYNRGNAAMEKKRWEDALKDFERVIRLSPEVEQPYNNLGIIYFNTGDFKSALTYFDSAISKNPNYAQAYYGKAVTLKRLMMESESKIAMQKSCALGHNIACLVLDLHNN